MKTNLQFTTKLSLVIVIFLFVSQSKAQSYLVGPPSSAVGASSNYTSHNHYNLFNVLNADGVYIDSLTIYPASAATSYTIVIQNSSQQLVTSYTGTTTVGSNQPERVKVDLFVPMGTGYRMGLTTTSVGMLRNSTGIVFPYTVPNVITFTGATFGTTYWYFFYNLRVSLPVFATDVALTGLVSPTDTFCAGVSPLVVRLKNNGPSDLSSVEIHSKVNNVAQPVFNWSGNLAVNDSADVVIGSYNFSSSAASYSIEAYSSLPNSIPDTSNHNDTVRHSGFTVLPELLASLNPVTTADFCDGDSVLATLSAPQANAFQWYFSGQMIPGATDSTYYIKQAGVYTVWYSDGVCSEMSDTLMGVSHPSPIATLTTFTPTTFCYGDSVWMFANTGTNITYEWERDGVIIPGETASTYLATESGDYVVITTNPGNCSTRSNTITVDAKPLHPADLGQDMIVCEDITVTLDAGPGADTYLWSTGQTSQIITLDTAIAGLGAKAYSVITSLDGCESTDTVRIEFILCTGIKDISNRKNYMIYPNPGQGSFTLDISAAGDEQIHLSISDLTGRLIFAEDISPRQGRFNKEYHLNLPAGVYLLRLKGDKMDESMHLIVNKR